MTVTAEAKTIQMLVSIVRSWRTEGCQQTSKAGNDGNKDGGLREKSPWLNDDAANNEQNGASLRRHVSGKDARQVHTGCDIVLGHVDEELMRPDRQAGEEGESSTACGIILSLGKSQDSEWLPH